ncbi:xanthine dehydrogenase family protein molybdopterin-binding subunit [Candidatus Parabeggiatoa sp. HSG14]|uniref:xanthine dehydrogenase family protein molybdopterin-binding subunit n=1 Tax=Candidatus Parabeggiatoa sp. HSG14 TaxID=3055593 RepID=UPI0025A6F426|nr:xanthine dehydrogenase family protein molybdopterin-binding subunit [Thiotrichales bacterium HSG14]
MMVDQGISRRRFLTLVGGVGAGLTIGINLPAAITKKATPEVSVTETSIFEPNAFIKIHTDNTVSVIIKHLEMGQGTYTGLSTLVAEELNADWAQIKPENAPADPKRYNNTSWGPYQGTGGSSGLANSFEQLRIAGAAAKAMLVAAAAELWQVNRAEVTVEKGVVSHKASNKKTTFGELANLAAKQSIPDEKSLILKEPKDFVYIGKKVARNDHGKIDGSAIFTQDVKLDGLLTAVIAHPPRFGGKVRAINRKKTLAIKGVIDVVEVPSGVAVLAKDFWTAKKGRDALEIDWDNSKASTVTTHKLMADYKRKANEEAGLAATHKGDAKKALEKADKVIEASFEFPYLAHAPMEPINCVALVNKQGCEIWNGAQFHTVDQSIVSSILGIKPEQVKINTLFAGGSFGRRANPYSDYIVEAVHIANAKKGTPIKLVWTREDDIRAGYFRPMYFHKVKAGLDKNGNPIAWEHHVVGQSIAAGTPFEGFLVKDGIDKTSIEGASNLSYSIPNLQVNLHTVDVNVPVLWWRSVGHTHTAFSTEVIIDELAHAAGKDPVEFRAKLMDKHPRHLGVLKMVAEKAKWGKSLPKGHGLGVAVHESFDSFAAQVAEVSVSDKSEIRVHRVVCVIDCGIAVNPDIIKAQIQGGIGFGLAAALESEITLENGQVVQSNFHDYKVLRMNQMPEVEVHIMPSTKPPTGVGEPGTPPIAPAVANAIFAATGKRLYNLPLKLA